MLFLQNLTILNHFQGMKTHLNLLILRRGFISNRAHHASLTNSDPDSFGQTQVNHRDVQLKAPWKMLVFELGPYNALDCMKRFKS